MILRSLLIVATPYHELCELLLRWRCVRRAHMCGVWALRCSLCVAVSCSVCCNVLQCVLRCVSSYMLAVCCSMLQCVARCVATYCIVCCDVWALKCSMCVAVSCSVLQCVAGCVAMRCIVCCDVWALKCSQFELFLPENFKSFWKRRSRDFSILLVVVNRSLCGT